MSVKVEIEQSLIDDLKVLHGIDALKEISEAVRKMHNDDADMVITNDGDKIEN